jgi:hypothetical protein
MQAIAEQIAKSPQFVQNLSDLTHETDLLSKLKDIRDELYMIKTIVDEQKRISQTLLGHQVRPTRNGLPTLFRPSMSTSAEVGDSESSTCTCCREDTLFVKTKRGVGSLADTADTPTLYSALAVFPTVLYVVLSALEAFLSVLPRAALPSVLEVFLAALAF